MDVIHLEIGLPGRVAIRFLSEVPRAATRGMGIGPPRDDEKVVDIHAALGGRADRDLDRFGVLLRSTNTRARLLTSLAILNLN